MKIEMTKEQLGIFRDALDLYTRVQIGQLSEPMMIAATAHGRMREYHAMSTMPEWHTIHRLITNCPPNASRGIFSPDNPPSAIEAYGMKKTIETYLYEKSGSRDFSRMADGKWFETKEPEIKIED